MRILYISQYFPPEMGAPSARVSELARHWSAQGHEVQVLTGFPNHPTGRVHPDYRSRFRRLVCRERIEGIDVVRTWLLPFPNRRAVERLLNYLSFTVSSSVTGSFLKSPEVIIATSPQLFVGLSGWWLSRIKKVPWVLEIRDLWPESITASGMSHPNSKAIRAIARLAKFLYRTADHIVVVTPAFKENLVKQHHIPDSKISVVENGVEIDLFHPGVDGESVKAELGIKGRFVVSFIGTHGLAHGLNTVLEAAEKVREGLPEALFLFVGEGADKEILMEQTRARRLDNVLFLPGQPREKVPALIGLSDACLVLLKKAEVFKTVIPTKMLEFMSCGKPVILGVDGQSRQLMEEAGAGIYVEPENIQALVAAIKRLFYDQALRKMLGDQGRRYVVERFSRRQMADKYLDLLEGIAARRA